MKWTGTNLRYQANAANAALCFLYRFVGGRPGVITTQPTSEADNHNTHSSVLQPVWSWLKFSLM